MEKITLDMNIQAIVQKYPQAAQVLMEHGIGCMGCAISSFEQLGQGLAAHGYSDEEIQELLEEMNEAIQV